MPHFLLEPAAVRRLLGAVVATATQNGPLSPERAGKVQAIATQLGLGFQELADATRDPKVKKPASRAEAEATYLAAAVLLADDRKGAKALKALGAELDLGLSLVELDRLAKEPDALAGLQVERSAEKKRLPKEPKAAPEEKERTTKSAARRGGAQRAAPAVATSSLPPHALPIGAGVGVLLMIIIALAVGLGGKKSPPPAAHGGTTTPSGAPQGTKPVAAPADALDADYRKAVLSWNRLQGAGRVDVAELATVLEVLERAIEAGRKSSDAAVKERGRGAEELRRSERFDELWVRSKVDHMRALDEAFDRALEDGDLAGARKRLDAVPAGLRQDEREWFEKRAETVKRGEAYATDVATFLGARPSGTDALNKGVALHARALEQNVAATKAHHDLVDWFRSKRDQSLGIFQAELTFRRAKSVEKAQDQRRILALIETDLRGFFEGLPGETLLELLELVDDRELLNTIKLLSKAGWAKVPVERLAPRFRRMEPARLVEMAMYADFPRAQWMRISKEDVLSITKPLDLFDSFFVSIGIPRAGWLRCTDAELLEHVRTWPLEVVEIFCRFLEPQQGARLYAGVRGRGGPAPAAPSRELVGVGSGFYVGPRHIATNAHVVGEATDVLVQTAKGDVQGKVVARDEALDLALIEVSLEGRPLALAPTAVLGRVFAYGYGAVGDSHALLLTTPGDVIAIDPDNTSIIVTAHINPGNSGGPLIDAGGRWVGVVVAKTLTTGAKDSVGIAIHGEVALRWFTAQGLRVAVDRTEAQGQKPPDDLVRASVVRVIVKQ